MLEELDPVEGLLVPGFPLEDLFHAVCILLVVFFQVPEISSWSVILEVLPIDPNWVVALLEDDRVLDSVPKAILLVFDLFDHYPAPDVGPLLGMVQN